MKCEVVKTSKGFRVYGPFTCMMDLDSMGNVTYCNVNTYCINYSKMIAAYRQTVK